MLLYTEVISPRLQYITDFSGKEILGQPFELTTDKQQFIQFNGPKLNYSSVRITPAEFWIQPVSLLFEKGISEQAVTCFTIDGFKSFFKTSGDLPFDIFAASFYLLSRYEEYLPHQKDMYGRYAHEHSLAYKEGFLDQPLVNIWLQYLVSSLLQKYPDLSARSSSFTFLPTYDIDIAWSYKEKGWRRNTGGLLRSLFKGDWRELKQRVNVLRNKQHDPYDAYGWMNQLHERHKLKPYYFFLLAEGTGKYDKNISPRKKAMVDLIRDHLIRYPVGIHPSWQSGDNDIILEKEIGTLEKISGNKVLSSRQHYIRFLLPQGYCRLIDKGIQFDFSMGYGSINGFRASVTSAFYWYDIENETQTTLTLFPFCYMEANSFYEQKYTSAQALDEMRHYYKAVKAVKGNYIMIWHNSFLGTDPLFEGWKEVYEQFLKEIG